MCGSILRGFQAEDTLKVKTEQVMIRSSSLQWWEEHQVMQDLSLQKAKTPKPQSITSEKHRKTIPRFVQIDGDKSQITVNAYRKTAARINAGKLGSNRKWTTENLQSDTAAKGGAIRQWVALVRRQLEDPTRQHRELGHSLAWIVTPRSG